MSFAFNRIWTKRINKSMEVNFEKDYTSYKSYYEEFINSAAREYYKQKYRESKQEETRGDFLKDPLYSYFATLNLHSKTTEEELTRQFRKLCKKYHPDLNSGDSEPVRKNKSEKLKKIIEAYKYIKSYRQKIV